MPTKKHITATAIAKASGLSVVCVHLILNGKRSPYLATARKLERGTGVSVDIWRSGDPSRIRAALAGIPPPK